MVRHRVRATSPREPGFHLSGDRTQYGDCLRIFQELCPGRFARTLKTIEPTIERLPCINRVCCAQYISIAHRACSGLSSSFIGKQRRTNISVKSSAPYRRRYRANAAMCARTRHRRRRSRLRLRAPGRSKICRCTIS